MKWGKSIDELLENWGDVDSELIEEDIDPEQSEKTDEEKETETPWLQGSKYERI